MATLHHNTLKSAVNKYLPLHEEGKTEEEVKAAIKADEKAFDTQGIEEIYQAIISTKIGDEQDIKPNTSSKKAYIVVTTFRDINNFGKTFNAGDDVSHFDAVRLERLVNNKLVELK